MGAEERKQDTWFVRTSYRDGRSDEKMFRQGVLDLPRPMTAFDAADHAVRVEVHDVLVGGARGIVRDVTVHVFGCTETGDPGRRHACTAFARYDDGLGRFMRQETWRDGDPQVEVGPVEGARFLPVDWQ